MVHLLALKRNQNTLRTLSFVLMLFFALFILSCLDNANPKLHLDFDAFYHSSQDLLSQRPPYTQGNFNPPIFFLIFKPFTYLSPHYAYLAWTFFMALLYFYAIKITTSLFLKQSPYQKSAPLLLMLSYPLITSLIIGQITALIFLLIISGYKAFLLKKEVMCGLLWGLVTAIKFFPGLLFFVLLKQRAYKSLLFFTAFTLLFIFMPLLFYPCSIYEDYVSSMSEIRWFSHSWNVSLFAIPFKFFLTQKATVPYMLTLKKAAYVLSMTGFCLYITLLLTKKLSVKSQFMLTLCFMFLISPLAWLYYLPILFIPICFLLNKTKHPDKADPPLILAAILLINLPLINDFLPAQHYAQCLIFCLFELPTLGIGLLGLLIFKTAPLPLIKKPPTLLEPLLMGGIVSSLCFSSLTFINYAILIFKSVKL